MMSRFWSPIVQSLSPYVAGEQPVISGLIKLNTNENPYGGWVLLCSIQRPISYLRGMPNAVARNWRWPCGSKQSWSGIFRRSGRGIF